MKQQYYLAGFIFLIILFFKNEAHSQDIHYSQFYNSPLNINPALTGIYNGDVRIIGSLRDQWRNVPVTYTTFSGSFDTRIYPKKSLKSFYGVGAIFNYDRAGDSKLNLTDLNLNGSYTYLINKENLITGGLMLGVASEGFTPGGLSWSTQWTGAAFDPNLPNQEGFDRNERYTYLETGLGGNYRYQKDSSRTYVNLGVGLFHLSTPTTSFINTSASLPMRTALYGEGNIQLTNSFDVQLNAIAQFQSIYTEYVLGGLGKLHINQKRGKKFRIDFGAAYRTSGFIIPKLAFQFNEYYLGLSYDVNLTPLSTSFGGQGGPEVHFRYIITKVKALNQRPCPVY